MLANFQLAVQRAQQLAAQVAAKLAGNPGGSYSGILMVSTWSVGTGVLLSRAESFGAVARQYEHYRPTYPDALLDDLATLRPARVLDVGCGTGKVAVGLAGRGLSVLSRLVLWRYR